ncbi:MAG: CorA family divalent cation transporter [Flavobacteriales bacterium]
MRFRLRENKGIVRKKNADYLLYLIIDAIIDNYANVYETINKKIGRIKDLASANLNESYVMKIEGFKQQFFQLKKAVSSLREAIFKLENCELEGFDKRYFSESKEQAHFLIDDIDFDLVQLESNLNLVFNLQNNRLNQVMKTLTIFSVIFIPLTFLAGIYGMNFDYIPETKSQYGYFILLGVMLVITLLTLFMIKKRNWFK